MKVLTAAEVREVDRLTTERYGIPSLLLMENAAAQTLRALEQRFGAVADRHILVLCGKGNNGGDGAAFARQAWMRRARVDVLLFARVENASGDARVNFEIVRNLAAHSDALRFFEDVGQPVWHAFRERLAHYDLLVDGLLGTGLERPAEGLYGEVIADLARFAETPRATRIIAIDLPSGLAADREHVIGPTVRADLTVTFTAPKPALVLPPAYLYAGEVVVAPIGSPDELIHSVGAKLNVIEASDVRRWLERTRRQPLSHKGTYGHVLLIAGSRGKPGAACLAARAALAAGAGLVTVATAPSSQSVIVAQVAEAMTEALEETAEGTIAEHALARALDLAAERDVVALGPGLTTHQSTQRFVRELLPRVRCPIIVDADGLNNLAPWPEELHGRERPVIATPHPGEMARLIGATNQYVLENRVSVAREFATAHHVWLVLKGHRTLIAAPNGQVYVNPTGNAGLATAGSGDVLTGILAGCLAQDRGEDPTDAVLAAVYLHGLAGDLAAQRVGTRAMLASDVTAHLGEALAQVGGEDERRSGSLPHALG
ncbi:MAG: NAD(P)H-hydrate dehydratase [Blastocatellia bacterium]|nr:NAD(P)H-hydrate dehydratase [Blastocatellia bacterium]MCX7751532.1 NAD(P)H-hydrate dehydratase [Blastocatellia bacterium]MDW8168632.1 NAD(P)H-hydrate dehydratase [Acidobacteriota bacterium]MDW8256527.1 NAD(P)H-hydrate dehydratase [Acidobacteriota bacterium]